MFRTRRPTSVRRRLRRRLKRVASRRDATRNDAANVAGTYVASGHSKPVGPVTVKLGPRLYRPAPVRSAGVTRHHERLRPRHPLASSTYARRSRVGLAVWLNRQAFVARVTSADPNKGRAIDVVAGFRTLTRFRSTGSVAEAGIPDVDRGPVVFARRFSCAVPWRRPFTSVASYGGPRRSHGTSPRRRRLRSDPQRFGVIAHLTHLRSEREPHHVRRSRFGAWSELTPGTRHPGRRSR